MDQNCDPPYDFSQDQPQRLPYTILGGLFIERPRSAMPMHAAAAKLPSLPKATQAAGRKPRTPHWSTWFGFPAARS